MKKEKQTQQATKLNRRSFFKISAATAAATALMGTGFAKAATKSEGKESFSLFRKEYNSIDDIYDITPNYRRMDQKNTIFSRGIWSAPIGEPEGLLKSFFAKWTGLVPNAMDGDPGFTQLEHALDLAAWAGHDTGTPLSGGGIRGTGELNNWERHVNPQVHQRYNFKNPLEAGRIIKRASRFLGADLVGIAPYDERWVYSKWFDYSKVLLEGLSPSEAVHEKAVFPFKPKSVISIAFEMDYDAVKTPGYMMDGAAGLEYSHMAEVGHKIAVFLNLLGYKAIPAGNDTGLSIPIAVQAGLGELSRMGTLITEKYGSRVRLAKVYTDLEMVPDKPITFGVWEFCKKCKKCADACPANAISQDDEPSPKPTTGSISSHPGVTKWYHNNEKCFGQWEKFGAACGYCLAVCPYNKLDIWHHDLAKVLVGLPVGRDIARQLDDVFGYGDIKPENVAAFWNKKD